MSPSFLSASAYGAVDTSAYLKSAFIHRGQKSSSSGPRTHASPPTQEKIIGPANAHLLQELERMYWKAVKRELGHIITTLREWQSPKFDSIVLDDEEDDLIHGFDAFVDQVSKHSRRYAVEYLGAKIRKIERKKAGIPPSYDDALQNQARAIRTNTKSQALIESVRRNLPERKADSKLERRACMLLQSAGWLDMDKLVEHRPPLPEAMRFWKRPTTSQLRLEGFDRSSLPIYGSLQCVICSNAIRGSFFECDIANCQESKGSRGEGFICQDCYDDGREHNRNHLVKSLKHCVLSNTISSEVGRAICQCGTVSRIDQDNQTRSLFPMTQVEQTEHRSTQGSGAVQCGLLELKHVVAEAKYASMLFKKEKRITLAYENRQARKEQEKQRARVEKERSKQQKQQEKMKRNHKSVKRLPQQQSTRKKRLGESIQIKEEEAADDVPWYMKPYVNKYPFGNVHMALQLGPLIIENGVRHAHHGAIVTSRNPPCLQGNLLTRVVEAEYSLNVSSDRVLRSQLRPRGFKRYKAIMKQVVGGAFSRFFDQVLEDDIVRLIVQCSQLDIEGLDIDDEEAILCESIDAVFIKVQRLLTSRLKIYLESVVKRLLDPAIVLRWDERTNNCQTFCDALIDTELFGRLVHTFGASQKPHRVSRLYAMSFVCRPSAYVSSRVQTKFEVPSGLTEEYLLKFRYGRHVDSDILDSLSEYWHDWGGFNSHLYKYQDLFPWDCTEAYCRFRSQCGDCNMAKHVWAFPFDSFSVIQMHLSRSRELYPGRISDQDWMRNRLGVLVAHEKLIVAATAMARSIDFHKATAWLHTSADPSIASDDRLKLGGIHRAQPYSHHFEHGVYHEYFIAQWAHLIHEEQIKAYEKLRMTRVNLPDVIPQKSSALFDENRDVDDDGGDNEGLLEDFAFDMGAYCIDGWDEPRAANDDGDSAADGLINADGDSNSDRDSSSDADGVVVAVAVTVAVGGGGGDCGSGCGGGCGG